MSKQSGFTLIELVMVIVILGILAATAIPKFAEVSGNAQYARLASALGAIKSAGAIVHSQALVEGVDNGTITIEGVSIDIVNGYPSAETILAASGVDLSVFENSAMVGGTTLLVQEEGSCLIGYIEAAAINSAPQYLGVTGDNNGVCIE